jgi:hypothetical protein
MDYFFWKIQNTPTYSSVRVHGCETRFGCVKRLRITTSDIRPTKRFSKPPNAKPSVFLDPKPYQPASVPPHLPNLLAHEGYSFSQSYHKTDASENGNGFEIRYGCVLRFRMTTSDMRSTKRFSKPPNAKRSLSGKEVQ